MAGYSVTVVRDKRDFFHDRSELLDVPQLVAGAKFCQLVDRMVNGATSSDSGPRSIPWVTPVLGSGCLAVGGSEEVNAAEVKRAVAEAVTRHFDQNPEAAADVGYEVAVLASMTGSFAEALAEERMLGTATHGPVVHDSATEGSGRSVNVTGHAAVGLMAAMLLNRLFHEAKALALRPPARGSDDVVRCSSKEFKDLRQECDEQCMQLEKAAEHLKDSESGAVWGAIHALLNDVRKGLSDRQVSLRNVGLLSEVGWFLLMRESGVYPGWNDLLFELMLLDDKRKEASERPWFMNLAAVGTKVRELFLLPTATSWRERAGASPTVSLARRVEFFDAIAELLRGQANARREAQNGRRLPVATAFVTSFDVELEMSLHAVLEPERSIFIVCPVQVLPDGDNSQAKLCWVRARLGRPASGLMGMEKGLDELLHPDSWEVVSPNLENHFDDPHVIHLAGCPLLELPDWTTERQFFEDLADRLTDQGMTFDSERMTLSHAVVVDEYLALQQSEAELLWAVAHKNEPTTSLALPALFTGSDTAGADSEVNGNPRFWMAMGVPLDDPAVRNRVITQLTIRRLQPKIGATAKRTRTAAEVNESSMRGEAMALDDGPMDSFGGMGAAFELAAEVDEYPSGAEGTNDVPRQSQDSGLSAPRKHVFISYSSRDSDLADQVVRGLEANDLPCWIASRDIPFGSNYAKEISSAIKGAGCLLLILTANSDGSDEVLAEQELAKEHGLSSRLVLSIDAYTPAAEGMDYHVVPVQRVEVSSSGPCAGPGWERLVSQLQSMLNVERDESSAQDDDDSQLPLAADKRGAGHLVGVVINRRVSRDDAGMLHWLGLDVVCDDAADFTEDIRHLAAHLRDRSTDWCIPKTKVCDE